MRTPKKNIEKHQRVNYAIKVPQVRVVANDGSQMGVIPTSEALRLAQEQGLDLVEVQAREKPPVCKIMDYGKFKYNQKRKAKEAKKKQTTIEIKEMKFRPRIEDHDFETKTNHIRRFLEDGNRCRVVVMFRGREMAHTDIGIEIINRVQEELKDVAVNDGKAKLEGKNMSLMLVPIKK